MKAGLLAQRSIFIGRELSAFTRAALHEGWMILTIDQSPELQPQNATEVLMHRFGVEGAGHAVPPCVSPGHIVLYGPENLPDSPPERREQG